MGFIVKKRKEQRATLPGETMPIGGTPDATAWTDFASVSLLPHGRYVLLFRELNQAAEFELELGTLFAGARKVTALAGTGEVRLNGGRLKFRIPSTIGFIWVRVAAGEGKEN